jgi:predicted RNA-binding Zn-ribbon protein involved in translation (DUF1610 family)
MARVRNGITEEMRDNPSYSKATCPRCGVWEIGFAALSRADNETLVCSRCGEAEAMEQFLTKQPLRTGWLTGDGYVTEVPEVEEFLTASEEARDRLLAMREENA